MFSRSPYIIVLALLSLRTPLPVQAFSCFCNIDTDSCVQNTCELSDPQFYNSKCAVEIKVFTNNGSIHSVTHFCLDGVVSDVQCGGIPYMSGIYAEYHKCCNNQELCNRCLIPEYLPYEVKIQLPLDPDCNFTILPSPSPSPTSSPVLPPNTRSQSSDLGYLIAAIAVGCISLLVCLVVVTVVLVEWKRHKCIRRQRNVSSTYSKGIGCDEVTRMSSSNG